jgi:GPH family glycoside/pentoside/hexuronide:cation symporter
MGSKKRVYLVNSLLTVPIMGIFYWLGPNDIAIMFILTFIGGVLSGPLSPIVWAMYADIADYSEWETGKRATGLFFSAATFAQKMGWTFGGAAAGWMLAWYGFEANIEQSAETIEGIKMLISWIPAAGCFIAGILVLFYKLDYKMMVKIEKELTERRNKEESTATP